MAARKRSPSMPDIAEEDADDLQSGTVRVARAVPLEGDEPVVARPSVIAAHRRAALVRRALRRAPTSPDPHDDED